MAMVADVCREPEGGRHGKSERTYALLVARGPLAHNTILFIMINDLVAVTTHAVIVCPARMKAA